MVPDQAPHGGDLAELFQQTGESLTKIATMSKSADVAPEVADGFANLAEQYMQLVDAMLEGSPVPQGSQPVSPEQGASKNSVPMR